MHITLGAQEAPTVLKLLAHDLRWATLAALARSDYKVQELGAQLGQPQNVVSYHLRRLFDQHLVTRARSHADTRDVYYSLNLSRLRELYFATGGALHPFLGDAPGGGVDTAPRESGPAVPAAAPVRVLFLCTHNSARSQMAEAIMRRLGGPGVAVFSAGTEATRVHPMALRVLDELHMPADGLRSKHLDEFIHDHFDYVITVCDRAREACPLFPGDPARIHWSFADPAAVEGAEAQHAAFLRTAHELTTRIRILLTLIAADHPKSPVTPSGLGT